MKTFFGMSALVLGVLLSTSAGADCGNDSSCFVGADGTGGEKSDGKAQGFHDELPSTRFPGSDLANSGNDMAGRLSISDQGTLSGAALGDDAVGHGTGIFGDWSGKCEAAAFGHC